MAKMEIYLSFKQSEENLYREIKKHSSYSAWIKEILIEKIAEDNAKKSIIQNRSVFTDIPQFKEFM